MLNHCIEYKVAGLGSPGSKGVDLICNETRFILSLVSKQYFHCPLGELKTGFFLAVTLVVV